MITNVVVIVYFLTPLLLVKHSKKIDFFLRVEQKLNTLHVKHITWSTLKKFSGHRCTRMYRFPAGCSSCHIHTTVVLQMNDE